MSKLKYILGLIYLAFTSAVFSQSLVISDMKELCDTASPEEYLTYEKGGWERGIVCVPPFPTGYEKQYWYNQDLDLTITIYSNGQKTIVISTLSREYYLGIRESLPVNNMKKRLVGYSDREYLMQVYSVAREYGPGFYYTITMERL
jgi:hypothetical protein